MTRPKKKPRPRKPLHPRVNNEKVMALLERIAARAREFRDEVRAELEREGVRVVSAGNVEAKLEPYSGVGSVLWRCWTFEFPEERKEG